MFFETITIYFHFFLKYCLLLCKLMLLYLIIKASTASRRSIFNNKELNVFYIEQCINFIKRVKCPYFNHM
jgi:hypothetical protein